MTTPMLATPATPRTDVFNDDNWVTELKMDGRRVIIDIAAGDPPTIKPYGRDGNPTYLPKPVLEQLSCCLMACTIDGELIGETLVVFDIIQIADLPEMDYDHRRKFLDGLFDRWSPELRPNILLVAAAGTTDDKLAMAERVRRLGGEGIVAKRRDSLYQEGKRSRDWVKLKRQHTVDCVVISLGVEKQNMIVGVFDGPSLTEFEVGRTVGDGPIAQPGDVIEVQCLYATDDNRLYQPVVKKIRTDKRPDECTIDQLDACRTNKTLALTWAEGWTD